VSLFENTAAPARSVAFETRSADQRLFVLLIQTISLCAGLFLLLVADWRTLSVEWIGRLLLFQLIWALWSWRKLGGTLLNPYVLFMLSATLFNAGLGLVEAVHLNNEPILPDFPDEIVRRSLLIVFASLSALHLGALFVLRDRPGGLGAPSASSPIGDRALRLIGWGLLAISFVPVMIQLNKAFSVALGGGYLALYQQDVGLAGLASAIQILADLAGPGIFFLIAGSKERPVVRRAGVVMLMFYCGIALFFGSRGSAMTLVAATWLWERTIARVPRILLIGAAAVLLVGVFPFIRETRNLSATERRTVSVRGTYSDLEENPAVDAIMEMGSSILSLAYTLELVPNYRPYDLGAGYFYGAFSLVPSLFWARHPSVARGTYSKWLIESVDPVTADMGGGLGFSFIAEAFLNFGAVGAPFVCLLLGYGIARLWIWSERSRDPGGFAVVATLLPYLLFFARGEFMFIPRPFVWYGLVPYGAYLFLRRASESHTA
jgi:oligosaccharide repeat unit polymerase